MLNGVGDAGAAGPPSPPDGFTDVAIVGRGSQGRVFRATKASIGKVVALKAFPLGPADTARERALRAELRALVALSQHPGVVDVHEMHVAGDWAWLEMDYCGDGSAATWVARPHSQVGGLPEGVAALLRIGGQVAEALGFAHHQGWVHGDVKPSNILFDAMGNARLCDFGLARLAVGAGLGEAAETGFRAPGTPRFQPPEVVAGAVPTAAGDVYALAETLRDLRRALIPDDVVAAAGTRNPDVTDTGKPGTGCPDILADLDVLLSRMSEPDPCLRPQADNVAERLDILAARIEADEPSTEAAVTQREPGARSSGRHAAGTRRRGSARGRVTVATTVAAVLVLLAGASVLLLLLHGNDAVTATGHPTDAQTWTPTPSPLPPANQRLPPPRALPSPNTPAAPGSGASAVPAPPLDTVTTGSASPGSADASSGTKMDTKRCVGDKVVRCAWVTYDDANRGVRASASVWDRTGGLDYSVSVVTVRLMYKHPVTGYEVVAETPADDGWHDEEDVVHGELVGCDIIAEIHGQAVYAQAVIRWTGAGSNGTEMDSFSFTGCKNL